MLVKLRSRIPGRRVAVIAEEASCKPAAGLLGVVVESLPADSCQMFPFVKTHVSGWIPEQRTLLEGCYTACLIRQLLASMAAVTLESAGGGSNLAVFTDNGHGWVAS